MTHDCDDPIVEAAEERRRAFERRESGDHEAALEHFRAAAARDPGNVWDLQGVAEALRDLARPDEAEALLNDIVRQHPRFAQARHVLGHLARGRNDHAAALEHFRAAAECDAGNVWNFQGAAEALRELGRLEEAEAILDDIVVRRPDFAHARYVLGQIARSRGDNAAALAHFRATAERAPGHVWALQSAADALRELGRLPEAETLLNEIVVGHPGFAYARPALGHIARSRGDHAAALEHFRAAAELDPGNVWSQQGAAEALRELGRLEEAEALLNDIVRQYPDFVHARPVLGHIARSRGDHAAALERFRAAAQLSPDNVWILQGVVDALRELGRFEAARDAAEAFWRRNPQSSDALLIYASALRRMAPRSEVIALIKQATTMDPSNVNARLALADEHLWSLQFDEAGALYEGVLAEGGNDVRALLGKAQVARRRGLRAEALAGFAAAVAADQGNGWARLEYARECAEAGRAEEAQEALEEAIARFPNWPQFPTLLGQLRCERGDESGARQAFEAAAKANGFDANAEVELALLDLRQGRADAAIERVERILRSHPNFVRAIAFLADIKQATREFAEALALRKQTLSLEPSSAWTHLALAGLQASLGQFSEADDTLARCRSLLGPSPELEMALAEMRRERGDLAGFRSTLDEAVAVFPHHFQLWFRRVWAQIEAGEFREAEQAMASPPPASARELSRIAILQGLNAAAQWRLDEAYRDFSRALEANPTDPWIHDLAARTALLGLNVDKAWRHASAQAYYDRSHRIAQSGAVKPSQALMGQLIDEYRLDAATVQHLYAAGCSADPVPALARIAVDAPGSTPAAIALLLAIRQAGRFRRPRSSVPPERRIPNRIAQFWDENIPDEVARLCDSWRQAHPSYDYMLFSRAEAARLLRTIGVAGVEAAFERAYEPAMKADIFRLAALFAAGGFYVDADDLCLAPVSSIDPGDCDLVLYQEEFGTLGNNVIGAAPRHPAIGAALADAISAVNRGDSDLLWLSTGPGLLTRTVARYLAQNLPERLATTCVLERHQIKRAVAMHCATTYKLTDRHWNRKHFQKTQARQKRRARALREFDPAGD